ncbi:MAG TPA: winged helix-turn-helix domain-containing protein [Nitrososphaera sp.]|jgi:predicted transcriptional regulator|nr:winged helix-turn-helix domain-containing protein [Nitrososphaera sp.]
MKYRNRTEIICQILEAANYHEGINKTKLMYKAFLSHDPLEGYVKILTESGLLRYDSVTRTYTTSEKGVRFLNLYNKIGELMKEEQQQI